MHCSHSERAWLGKQVSSPARSRSKSPHSRPPQPPGAAFHSAPVRFASVFNFSLVVPGGISRAVSIAAVIRFLL